MEDRRTFQQPGYEEFLRKPCRRIKDRRKITEIRLINGVRSYMRLSAESIDIVPIVNCERVARDDRRKKRLI